MMSKEENLHSNDTEMELIWDPEDISPNYVWTFSEFLDQYNELYEWLVQIQLRIYSLSDPPDDQQENLRRHRYRLKLFVCQGEKVAERFSLSKEEIIWRVSYLTNKWNQLQNIFTPCRGYFQDTVMEVDLAQEETFLRNWLDAMEDQIQPITCKLPKGCSLYALKERYKDNQILLKDVKAHGPILKNIIRQYEKQTKESSNFVQNTIVGDSPLIKEEDICVKNLSKVPRKIKCLEKRWHQIYLRSLEWHYLLEGVIRDFKVQDHIYTISDSEDEPVSKCRRISSTSNNLHHKKCYLFDWSDYEHCSSENGSYIEDDYVMTNSNIEGKKTFSKNNLQSSTFTKKVINNLEAVTEMNSYDDSNSAKFSIHSENNFNESTSDSNNCIYNSNRKVKEDSSNFSQLSRLADTTKETPNCGVFDYKHDSDSENKKNNVLISPLKRYNEAECFFAKTKGEKVYNFSCKKLKNIDVYEDEEQEQKILQHIIDTAVDPTDWLDGNITVTESDESVVDKTEQFFHIDDEIVLKDSKEKIKSLDTEAIACDKKFIHQLVKDAENLVREPIKFQGIITQKHYVEPSEKLTEGKQCQINNWLNSQSVTSRSITQLDAKNNNNNMQDSCDASGELTTGESDFESKESDYEGCDTSLATEKGNEEMLHCASNTSSATEFQFDGLKKKDIRGKKRNAQRPHSANIVFENDETLQSLMTSKYIFSSSETALDRMEKLNMKQRILCETFYGVTPNCNKGSVCSLNKNVLQTTSPSSLTVGNNFKRRRMKIRKKHNQSLNTKIDSDLDETLGKSARKAEMKCQFNHSPFHTPTKIISSDSDNISCCSKFSKTFSPSGKGGCISRIVMTSSTEKCLSDSSMVSADSPVNKSKKVISYPIENITSSGSNFQNHQMNFSDQETTTQPEDASSLSEQAWDSYQEFKYLSEPYSEDVDVDAERKLIEFGDDYRKYIDSDESSFYNIPSRRRRSSFHRRVRKIRSSSSDSDSDLENIQRAIEESENKLNLFEKSLSEQLNSISSPLNWDEFIANARSNAKYLQEIKLNLEDEKLDSNFNMVQSIINRWELLEAKAREKHFQSVQIHRLQCQLKSIRINLENIVYSCSTFAVDTTFESFSQISIRLDKIKSLITECDGLKVDISTLNTQVHRYLSEVAPSFTTLQDEMTELFRLWDETHRRVNSELSRMEQIEVTYHAWEEQKVELCRALKQDSDALQVVDAAVDNGKLTESVTASVRDVAKLLNERRKYSFAVQNKDQFLSQDVFESTHEMKKIEDHLSDSGTSGYESCSSDDLSERERRLAYLKRLAKDLEASLAPGCHAWREINSTLDQAEKELKGLQDHCRYLILKTTETFDPSSKSLCFSSNSKRRILAREGKSSRNSRREKRMKILGSRRDWIWRVARAAVPFQVALMLLVCVACLLEPNCCDSVNTFNLSFTPQLRFVHGSSPI